MAAVMRTWERRHLIWYMVIGQLRGDAALQLFGYLWWIVEPLALAATYTFVISGVFKRGGPDLPFFIITGMLPWRWTTNGISEAIGAVRRSSGLLHSGYIPKLVFPLVSLGVSGARFLVAQAAVLVAIAAFTNYVEGPLYYLPLVMVVHLLFNVGLSLVFSHFGAYYVDTKNFWSIFGRLWFYFSPIMYETPKLQPTWYLFYHSNPAIGLIELYRWVILGRSAPTLGVVLWTLSFSVGMLLWGMYLHAKHDYHYAKVI